MSEPAVRSLAPEMDPSVVAAIDARLTGVADEHGVAIGWAIESGSRAWGFPSPDSDYDCRFLFVRPAAAYAAPWRPRDVIETPLDDVLDVNGWDLVKAVRLAVKGNATVGEWLRSPLVYGGESAFRDELLALVDAVADRPALVRHYLHVGRDNWARAGVGDGATPLKRIFYALRPAAVLHWLDVVGTGWPPMNLQQLLDEAPPAEAVLASVHELVAAKRVTREMGLGTVPDPIRRFVEERLLATQEEPSTRDVEAARLLATEGFARLVARWAPTG